MTEPLKIAIIGSGMAGLAAGWLCRRVGHEVVLYEAQARRGMDAHSLRVDTPSGPGIVDVPLRVMSPHAWRNVLALSEQVGVSTFATDTFAAFSWRGGETWLRNGALRVGGIRFPHLGSWRSINPHAAAVGWGLLRWRLTPPHDGETLEAYTKRADLPRTFVRGFLVPLLTTICTCDETTLFAWPAVPLLGLFRQILLGDTLRRLKGGTPALVDGLTRNLELRAPERVVSVAPDGSHVVVRTASGHHDRFDRVFIATQANQVEGFLDPSFARERRVLSRFRYDAGELVTHTDPRFMPRRRQDWTPLSYTIDRDLSTQMFTVWVNPVEPSLKDARPIFQSWNPLEALPSEHILASVKLQRAVVDTSTQAAHHDLEALHNDPDRKVFFCGSYAAAGVPLLESAVCSAVAIARRVGAYPPWSLD